MHNFSVTFLLQIGLNTKVGSKPLFHAGHDTRCSKTTVFSNFPKRDFDTYLYDVYIIRKSKMFVAISSRLIHNIAWTMYLKEVAVLSSKESGNNCKY